MIKRHSLAILLFAASTSVASGGQDEGNHSELAEAPSLYAEFAVQATYKAVGEPLELVNLSLYGPGAELTWTFYEYDAERVLHIVDRRSGEAPQDFAYQAPGHKLVELSIRHQGQTVLQSGSFRVFDSFDETASTRAMSRYMGQVRRNIEKMAKDPAFVRFVEAKAERGETTLSLADATELFGSSRGSSLAPTFDLNGTDLVPVIELVGFGNFGALVPGMPPMIVNDLVEYGSFVTASRFVNGWKEIQLAQDRELGEPILLVTLVGDWDNPRGRRAGCTCTPNPHTNRNTCSSSDILSGNCGVIGICWGGCPETE